MDRGAPARARELLVKVGTRDAKAPSPILLGSIVVVAVSGLVYELALGTLATYFLGNAATQFSIVLGVYLSAMGAGALVSPRLRGPLATRFVEVETALALVGGTSAATLFATFGRLPEFRAFLYADVFVIGALVGVELPLLLGLLRDQLGFEESIVSGLSLDYAGALLASVLFPLVLLPGLGLVRTAALSGVVNALVALLGTSLVPRGQGRLARQVAPLVTLVMLLALAAYSGPLVRATAD